MGSPKSGGFDQLPTLNPQQLTSLQQLLQQSGPMLGQAGQAYQQYLPGGSGYGAIEKQANENFQQNTLPAILNAYGGDNKGSSALNQALAAGGSNLNSSLAALRAQGGLQAAQGLGSLGLGGQNLGLGTPSFAYTNQATRQPGTWEGIGQGALSGLGSFLGQKSGSMGGAPQSAWQRALSGAGAGAAGGAALGPWGAAGGGAIGALLSLFNK